MNDQMLEWAKLIVLPVLGAVGTWLAQRLKPRPEKQKEQARAEQESLKALRAEMELWRDTLGWAKTEIKDLQGRVVGLEQENKHLRRGQAEQEQRNAELMLRHEEVLAHVDEIWERIDAASPEVQLVFSEPPLRTKRPARRPARAKKEVAAPAATGAA